ncbi:MAG: zf-HC2 domain-containing protein [Longimicrobiales bacterium]|nr:zf-HC2 domain-containing protein [Longimicrobiales bacterium]
MSEHETARLSDYLDGELGPVEREAVEAHLAGCAECTRTLEDLRAVVAGAGRLADVPPDRDLWPGVERRLAPRAGEAEGQESRARVVPFRRRVVLTVPQLAAAAIALVLLSASAVWLAVPGPADAPPAMAVAPASSATFAAFVDYDETLAALEAEYRTRREALDPETIRVVERNLAIIDRAIAEARAALAADPSSGFLSEHLVDAMRRKADLLRRAAVLAQTET